MPRPTAKYDSDLTGATRYRTSWFGAKLILQVEQRHIAYWKGTLQPGVDRTPVYETSWRDAATQDLAVIEYLHSKEDIPPPDLGAAGIVRQRPGKPKQ